MNGHTSVTLGQKTSRAEEHRSWRGLRLHRFLTSVDDRDLTGPRGNRREAQGRLWSGAGRGLMEVMTSHKTRQGQIDMGHDGHDVSIAVKLMSSSTAALPSHARPVSWVNSASARITSCRAKETQEQDSILCSRHWSASSLLALV